MPGFCFRQHMKKRSPLLWQTLFILIETYLFDFIKSVGHERSHFCCTAENPARKYRDEARPRQGLLRSREFLMKDLYTFDASTKDALQTYHGVREAYSAFFNELKLPYLSAEADSGSIGGDLSHEYHILSPKGEDRIIRCSSCDYIANEELVKGGSEPFLKELHDGRIQAPEPSLSERILSFELLADLNPFFSIVYGFNRDRKTKYIVIYPSFVAYGHEGDEREATLNLDVLKSTFPELEALDPAAGRPTETDRIGMKTQYVFDYRISEFLKSSCKEFLSTQRNTEVDFGDIAIVDLVKIEEGDGCPKCEGGILEAHTSIELGHTFNLGTKYSKRLNARVPGYSPSTGIQQHTTTKNQVSLEEVEGTSVKEEADSQIFLEMGCYGIGVSRLIAAVADSLADGKGLNWPRVIAPFEAVVIPIPGFEYDANVVLDLLSQEAVVLPLVTPHRSRTIDAILDDRPKNVAWKLRDADLIGYPILVVLGRAWKNERKCEVQCRQLGSLRQEVPLQELRGFVDGLLAKLSHLPSTHQL